MNTVAGLVDRVRSLVQGGVYDELNRLAMPYTPGDSTITVQYEPRGFGQGTRFSAGLNTFLSWQVAALSKQVTCQAGVDSSVDAALPVGTVIRVRPRFTDHTIFDALCRDIRRMSSPDDGLYRVGSWNPQVDTLNEAWVVPPPHSEMQRVLGFYYANPGTDRRWIDATSVRLQKSDTETRLRVDRALSPSQTIEVVYAVPFLVPTSLDDDLDALGLTGALADIPAYGAAVSLMMGQEASRNSLYSQSDTRRPDEVQAGALMGTAREYARMRDSLVQAEHARLVQRFPYQQKMSGQEWWSTDNAAWTIFMGS